MHILLTGSSGWLGRFLAPRLRTAGHVVTGLDVAPGADTDILGSVADRAAVDRAFARGVAHIAALDLAPLLGFDTFIISAPPPFDRAAATELKRDAAAVIARHFPDAPELFARRGWRLPASLGRVYDPGHAERRLGF